MPITVASDLTPGFMGAGSNTTGRFDINASAAALGITSPLGVTSATLSFSFTDNIDPYATTAGFTGASRIVQGTTTCGATLGSCVEHWYWLDTYVTTNVDPIETARVTVGSQSSDASSPYHLSTVGPYLTPQGQGSCSFTCGFVQTTRQRCAPLFNGYICDGPWPVYTENWTYYSAFDGAFSLNLTLDAAALLDLASDGLLDFSLSAFAGDFNFMSASLTADIYARTGGDDPVDPTNPNDPVTPVGVPEPTTSGLVMAGLLMLVARTKRRDAQRHRR